MNTTRISPARELGLLIGEAWAILVGDMRNLIISLLFPPAAAAIVIWIAGENMFVSCESSKSACFIIVCAAIWGGLFNSIQTIVKERDNVKRDYVSGALRIGCYTASRAIVQFGLCVVQSALLCLSFWGIRAVYGNEPPTYNCVGTNDGIASYRTMEQRIAAIQANGTDAMIEVFPGLSHGFGLGTGTVAEGWIDHAVTFWEKKTN